MTATQGKIYGYCRISTAKQNIERQIRSIKSYCKLTFGEEYENIADIRQEVFTGRKLKERKAFNKLMKEVKEGDTIIFDSVSRMSRNAQEGFKTYIELFNRGVNLIFLRERTIDTSAFKSAVGDNKLDVHIETGDTDTDDFVNGIMSEVVKYISKLAERQILLAFEQSQKEVDDLSDRTKGGLKTARINGKQIGQRSGAKLIVKKAQPAKDIIRKHSKDFGGTLNDTETMKLAGVSRNTFYKYKKELANELAESEV